MADIQPFKGLRYDPNFAGDNSLNICPPFDAITPDLQKSLHERSNFNIVRLELARRNQDINHYKNAANTLTEWVNSGVLKYDSKPSIYVTKEEFQYRGVKQVRRGFISNVKIEEYSKKIILPHEKTRLEWVEDRAQLMSESRSNFSPLLVIYKDDRFLSVGKLIRTISGGDPTSVFSPPDMPKLSIWKITDPGTISIIQKKMSSSQLFIADGHHRYEASIIYRDKNISVNNKSNNSFDYRMMMLVSYDEPGLITRGYHRVVSDLTNTEYKNIVNNINKYFTITKFDIPNKIDKNFIDSFIKKLDTRKDKEIIFGFYDSKNRSLSIAYDKNISLNGNALENSEYFKIHELIFSQSISLDREDKVILPISDSKMISDYIAKEHLDMVFFMRPLPLYEFSEIVSNGWRLPAKATNFYPKPPAGSVLQNLEI
ncbi:MAG: hypothetical protein CL748_04510 [Chloroflexi bacterium]|nr:hypothetical protein [Chloroflexota bacterium]|tara:strand:+ start:125 stop:1408 length:1284 start_codon:yes stop_codon:yes gene_type:complete